MICFQGYRHCDEQNIIQTNLTLVGKLSDKHKHRVALSCCMGDINNKMSIAKFMCFCLHDVIYLFIYFFWGGGGTWELSLLCLLV